MRDRKEVRREGGTRTEEKKVSLKGSRVVRKKRRIRRIWIGFDRV